MYIPLVSIELGAPIEIARTVRTAMFIAHMNAADVFLEIFLGEKARRTELALMPG